MIVTDIRKRVIAFVTEQCVALLYVEETVLIESGDGGGFWFFNILELRLNVSYDFWHAKRGEGCDGADLSDLITQSNTEPATGQRAVISTFCLFCYSGRKG